MEALGEYEAVIAILIGIFLCLFGYRVKKVAFIVIWFVIGFYLMSFLAPKITDNQTWQLILEAGAGLLLGVLGFTIEKFCIFAVATFSVSTAIIDSFQMTEFWPIALAIVVGIVVGCIATALIKPLGIITTSLSGARLIAKYVVAGIPAIDHNPWFFIILFACFGIGLLFQFKTCRHIE